MATSAEVLGMLIPDGGWIAVGSDYEGIQFVNCEPITKEQFEAGFADFEVWKAQQDASKEADKAELLAKLGITEDEAKLLFS